MKSPTGKRIFFVLATLWAAGVAIRYGLMTPDLPPELLWRLFESTSEFFIWQLAGFLAILCSFVWGRLDPYRGRAMAVYLILSTLLLLLLSRELQLLPLFGLFLLWQVSAVNTVRVILRRRFGEALGTLGLAPAVLLVALMPLWFLLGATGSFSAPIVGTVLLAVALPGLWKGMKTWGYDAGKLFGRLDGLSPLGLVSLEVLWLTLFIAFAWASVGEMGSDSSRSHLPYVKSVAETGDFEQPIINFGRLTPRAAQSWFVAAYTVGGTRFAKWLSWICLAFCALLLVEELGRRIGDRNWGLFGACVALTCPFLLYLSTTLYIDHIILLICLSAMIALFRSAGESPLAGVFLSAFLMAGVAQIKYNALIFVAVWALSVVVYLCRRLSVRQALAWAMLVFLFLGVLASPWLLHTYAKTGNPFFPYFNRVFGSPLWPDDYPTSPGQSRYSLGGWKGWLTLPWLLTFQTSKITPRRDGFMGFCWLALIPFLLVGLKSRFKGSGLGLGISGAAMIAAVCLVTPNVRYWLAAYPLVLIPFLILTKQAWDGTAWKLSRPLATGGAVVVGAALLLPLPFWTAFESYGYFPWDAYTKAISEESWLESLYPGYPAIRQLNQRVKPLDRVVVTSFLAVHTIDAQSHELPYWHVQILGLKGVDAFERFLEENNIRYWVVDFRNADELKWFDRAFEASTRYWTIERMVSASGPVGVYDVSRSPLPPTFKLIGTHTLEPRLKAADNRDVDLPGWEDWTRDPTRAPLSGPDSVQLKPMSIVSQRLPKPPGTDLWSVTVELEAEERSTAILQLDWLDGNSRRIGSFESKSEAGFWASSFRGYLFAQVPERAEYARIYVKSWKTPLSVGEVLVKIWAQSPRAGR